MKASRLAELGLLILLVAALSLVAASREMGNDEGIWSYIGRVWVDHGIPPYTGSVENKTPGIFLLNAAEYRLWGLDIGLVRGVGVAAILLAGVFIYGIARRIQDHRAGVASAVAFCLSMVWGLVDGACTAQTETFMVLFTVAGFSCLLRAHSIAQARGLAAAGTGWIFAAGLAMGGAIAFKQIAIASAGALLVSYLILFAPKTVDPRSVGRLSFAACLLGIGVLMTTAISVVPLLRSGVSLADYWDGAWMILLNPASRGDGGMLRWYRLLQIFSNSRCVVFYPFLCAFLISREWRASRYFWCLLVWLVCDLAGANGSGNYYGHQIKQALPTLSLICGLTFSRFLSSSRLSASDRVAPSTYPLALLGLFMMFCPLDQIGRHVNRWWIGFVDERVELGHWLHDHTVKDDSVFVYGNNGNQVMSFSGRVSPGRFFNSIFVTDEKSRKELLRDLNLHVPRFFLNEVGTPGFAGDVEAFVRAHFHLLRSQSGLEIYERNAAAGS